MTRGESWELESTDTEVLISQPIYGRHPVNMGGSLHSSMYKKIQQLHEESLRKTGNAFIIGNLLSIESTLYIQASARRLILAGKFLFCLKIIFLWCRDTEYLKLSFQSEVTTTTTISGLGLGLGLESGLV